MIYSSSPLHMWSSVCIQFTAHLLCLCCSHSRSTWRCGWLAVSDCGDQRLGGAEIDWDSKDGRCRWAIIARRRSRSLQSCESKIRVDGVTSKSLNTGCQKWNAVNQTHIKNIIFSLCQTTSERWWCWEDTTWIFASRCLGGGIWGKLLCVRLIFLL